MELSEGQKRQAMSRLLLSRMRLLNNHGFFGLLLMHMIYSLRPGLDTAATDGVRIWFDPVFLAELSDRELDFVMMHEVLHCALDHCARKADRDPELFNIACDIVVNSVILQENGMDKASITLRAYGESMHLAPDGKEGHLYTAEQVYDMLERKTGSHSGKKGRAKAAPLPGWDDHSQWGTAQGNESLSEVWQKRVVDACQAVSVREKNLGRGLLPAFARRIYEALQSPKIDWRTILNEFVQEEINDYSFSPPDRRYYDTPFFLPDYNELGDSEQAVDILFMIDTSASMTDKEIGAAFSEVRGAIEQFGGKLKGWLGFFDAAVIEPVAFETVEEAEKIRPAGGGGTDFGVIFSYVAEKMTEKLPNCIIIMTDGYAPFPEEKAALGIPVLWLVNNEDVAPPWGKVARLN